MGRFEESNKFSPERPIYLNKANTGFKSDAEVELAVQKLRDRKWLCVVGESKEPLHMSFDDPALLNEFLREAATAGCKIKAANKLFVDDGADFPEGGESEDAESEDSELTPQQKAAATRAANKAAKDAANA